MLPSCHCSIARPYKVFYHSVLQPGEETSDIKININLPYFDELLLANTTSKIHAISIDVHHPIAVQIVLSSHRNKPIYLKCKKEGKDYSGASFSIQSLYP